MAQSAAKAQALIRDMSNKLQERFANNSGLNTITQANDAQGWPYILLSHNGVVAEGNPVVFIRIRGISAVSVDVFGNFLYSYAPHNLDLAYELASANDPEVTLADLATCQFEAIKTGVEYLQYSIANGTAVSEASVDAATAIVDLQELQWPTKSV